MLNQDLKLNQDLFSDDVEQVALRNGFGEGLLETAKADERIVGLCADLTESTRMHLFAKEFPERFVEVGITEQSMACVAAGMAAMGKIPFMSSYAMFNPGRNWEQIRTVIAYNNVPVKIVGSHAGVSVGPDGGTHQAIEDIALTRVMPNMDVIVPADAVEARKATLAIAKSNKPAYLRLARENTPVITTEETPFEIGKAHILYESESPQVAIIAIGPMVHQALLAAKELEKEGIGSIVVNSASVKPLDEATITEVAKKCEAVVTAETHQVAGGLGGAVAELLAQKAPTKMAFVGVQDKFGQSGTPDELMRHYCLDASSIVRAVMRVI